MKTLPLFLGLFVVGCTRAVAQTPTPAPPSPPAPPTPVVVAAREVDDFHQSPRPDQLNGQHHRLSFGGDSMDAPVEGAIEWVVVGADTPVAVPWELGVGHGPFYRVYPKDAALAARASDGLTVLTAATARLPVPSERAGTFDLDVSVTPRGGYPIEDVASIGCAAPTRLVAESEAGRWLARASTGSIALSWFGRTPAGAEVLLHGSLPFSIAPEKAWVAIEHS